MKYTWATFVIIGIWVAIALIIGNRESSQPEQLFLFATICTVVISLLGYR